MSRRENVDSLNTNNVNTENKNLTRLSDQDEFALRITDDQIQSERANGETTYAKYLEGLRDNARVEDGKRIERDAILKQYPIEKLQELAKNGDYDTLSFVNAKLKALDKRTDFEADNSFYKNLSIENSERNAALENGNNVKVSMPEYAMARVGENGAEGSMGAGNETGANGFGGITDSMSEGSKGSFSGLGNENGTMGINDTNGSNNGLHNTNTELPGAMPERGSENSVSTQSQGIVPDSTVSENRINSESVDGKNRGEYNENNRDVKIPNASELKNSQTVQNKMYDFVKKGPYKGETIRPYIDSNGTNSLVNEIMNGGKPVKDGSLKNGLRWDVPGHFRGSEGIWELVVDLDNNIIVHFNFVEK